MRKFVDLGSRVGAGLSLAATWAAGLIMVGMTLHILVEIVLRVHGRSTHILEEYVGYGVGAMIFLGLGRCLEQGELIRVDLLQRRLTPPVRRVVEIVICLLTLSIMALPIRSFTISVLRHFEAGTISTTAAATPIWIPEAIVLAGMAIFALQLALYALRLFFGGRVVEMASEFK